MWFLSVRGGVVGLILGDIFSVHQGHAPPGIPGCKHKPGRIVLKQGVCKLMAHMASLAPGGFCPRSQPRKRRGEGRALLILWTPVLTLAWVQALGDVTGPCRSAV